MSKITILMTVEYETDMPAPVFATALQRCKTDLEDDLALHGVSVKVKQIRKLPSDPPSAKGALR